VGNWSNFSWLKWPTKKKQKMEITEKSIHEARVFYSAFDFEWIKGENSSMIEKYRDIVQNGDMMFIEFQSGKRINMDLLNEYMITYPAQPVQVIQQPTPIQVQPTPTPNSNFSVTSIQYEDNKNVNVDSPIYKLLRKQKKNMVEISIKLKINLPPKDLYTVLSGSFDDAEKEIIDFVLDGVDIEGIKLSLADSIRKNYYSETAKVNEGQKKNSKRETNE